MPGSCWWRCAVFCVWWKLCADDWRKLTELTREECRLAATWRHLARPLHQHPPAPTISHQPHSLLLIVITSVLWNYFYVLSVFSEYEKIVWIVGIWWIVVNETQRAQFKHSTALMIFSSFTKYSKNKYAISYRLGSRIVVKYFFIFVKYFSRPKLGTYSGRKPTSRGRSSAKRRNSGSPELEAQVEASIILSLYIIHSICSGQ